MAIAESRGGGEGFSARTQLAEKRVYKFAQALIALASLSSFTRVKCFVYIWAIDGSDSLCRLTFF